MGQCMKLDDLTAVRHVTMTLSHSNITTMYYWYMNSNLYVLCFHITIRTLKYITEK